MSCQTIANLTILTLFSIFGALYFLSIEAPELEEDPHVIPSDHFAYQQYPPITVQEKQERIIKIRHHLDACNIKTEETIEWVNDQ